MRKKEFYQRQLSVSYTHLNSTLLNNILERITLGLGKDREGYYRALAKSIMISADLAHAVHPNLGDKQMCIRDSLKLLITN